MNTGIYALFWQIDGSVYIGLSDNLDRRRNIHFNKLKRFIHPNYKVQNKYNMHGMPEFIILEFCEIDQLHYKEILWCNEFDNLLNIAEPGRPISSPFARNSKYSKFSILKVFSLLYKGILNSSQISKITNVNLNTVKAIAAGTKHAWLNSEYPEQYAIMLSINRHSFIKGPGIGKGLYTYTILSPGGVEYNTNSLTDFCSKIPELSHNVRSAASYLARVSSNTKYYKSYKGWRCFKELRSNG